MEDVEEKAEGGAEEERDADQQLAVLTLDQESRLSQDIQSLQLEDDIVSFLRTPNEYSEGEDFDQYRPILSSNQQSRMSRRGRTLLHRVGEMNSFERVLDELSEEEDDADQRRTMLTSNQQPTMSEGQGHLRAVEEIGVFDEVPDGHFEEEPEAGRPDPRLQLRQTIPELRAEFSRFCQAAGHLRPDIETLHGLAEQVREELRT